MNYKLKKIIGGVFGVIVVVGDISYYVISVDTDSRQLVVDGDVSDVNYEDYH